MTMSPSQGADAALARIIMGARRGEKVIYANDDHLDLRLANLSLEYPRKHRQTSANG